MSFRSQRIRLSDGPSWTVVDDALRPVAQVERFLAHERAIGVSPNTVRSYSYGLALWWNHLALVGQPWDAFDESTVRLFIRFLQTGDPAGTAHVGPAPAVHRPATINARMAAVQAFYRHAEAIGAVKTLAPLSTSLTSRRGGYTPFLAGIAKQAPRAARTFKVREARRPRTPVLSPDHIRTILDSCATLQPDGSWSGGLAGLRDRLFFAVLAETGMRIGEALSLRHKDFHIGRGEQPYLWVVPRQDHPHGVRVKRRETSELVISDELEALYSTYVWALMDAGIDLVIDEGLNDWFVFVTTVGAPQFQPMRAESVYRRVRQINSSCSNLPLGWSPHWLRHTHATALLLNGTPFHVVQRRLGHADVQTTLNTYGWVDQEAELKALTTWKTYSGKEVPS